VPAYLLKKRRSTVYKIVGLSYCDLVSDTFPDTGKGAMITKNFENYTVSHYEIINPFIKKVIS
jgi:hypothetical protein